MVGLLGNIISIKDKQPKVDSSAYINPYAVVIGDVTIHAGVSLWPGVTVRGDDEHAEIGRGTAILDKSYIDTSRGHIVDIGEGVLISHGAILHGCKVGNGVLIGKGAIIQEGSEIGSETVILNGAYIPTKAKIPPRSKVAGVPGKVIGNVTDEEILEVRNKHTEILKKSKEYGNWFVAKQI